MRIVLTCICIIDRVNLEEYNIYLSNFSEGRWLSKNATI